MKTRDHFNKATAEELGKDLKIVKEVTTYFWKRVKKDLAEANYNAIFIKNFGTIVTSRYKLRKEILQLINMIRYSQDKKQEVKDELYKRLRKLLERRNEIAKTYLEVKRKWSKAKV